MACTQKTAAESNLIAKQQGPTLLTVPFTALLDDCHVSKLLSSSMYGRGWHLDGPKLLHYDAWPLMPHPHVTLPSTFPSGCQGVWALGATIYIRVRIFCCWRTQVHFLNHTALVTGSIFCQQNCLETNFVFDGPLHQVSYCHFITWPAAPRGLLWRVGQRGGIGKKALGMRMLL